MELVRKEGARSLVWGYFGLKKGSDGRGIDDGVVICRTCFGSVVARNGNTSNLFTHLSTHHKKLYATLMDEVKARKRKEREANATPQLPVGQPSLTQVIEKSQKYEKKGKRWKELTNSITFCIAKDSLPIRIVEKPGFTRMLKSFDGRYELPSRSYFSRTAIPDLYISVREEVKKEIVPVQYFAATTDLWSSVGLRPYMSYTIHFVDDNWKLSSRCLQTHYLPQDHTGENLADAMKETLCTWDLKEANQVCITTDSGSNIINAARRLNWNRLSCFGHNLNLAITKAFNGDTRCARALGVCHKVVSSFSLSWKRRRDLIKSQIDLKVPQHSLIAHTKYMYSHILIIKLM